MAPKKQNHYNDTEIGRPQLPLRIRHISYARCTKLPQMKDDDGILRNVTRKEERELGGSEYNP